MPRKESEAVPEGNGPVPQQEKFGSGEPTLADVYRRFEERFDRQQKIMDSCLDRQQKITDSYFDRWNRRLDEILDETRVMDQHAASLEQDDRQPHGGRWASKHEHSRAHRGRRYCSTNDAWG